MAEVYANNAKGKLAEPAAAGDTTLVLEPGHTLPGIGEGEWFRATLYRWEFGAEGIHEYDHEVVKVVAVAGDTLTVERALEGTASGFDPGTPVEMRWTAGSALGLAGSANQPGVPTIPYDDRGGLRQVDGPNGAQAIVEGLGLFVFNQGSDEPDDDESCFATESGRWLLEAAHWDVIDTWQLPDDDARDAFDEDALERFASRVLHGTASCAIITVSSISSVSFTGTVVGAAVGDRVVATPPAELGSDVRHTGRLSYHAWVSAPDTATVTLTNASAATASINPAIHTAWPITVFKGV